MRVCQAGVSSRERGWQEEHYLFRKERNEELAIGMMHLVVSTVSRHEMNALQVVRCGVFNEDRNGRQH